MNENPYMMLAKVILPKEMTEYFDLTKVRTDEYNGEPKNRELLSPPLGFSILTSRWQ